MPCDRVVVIDAVIVECGDVLDVFLHPRHGVTQSLLSESGLDAEGWRDVAQGVQGSLLRLSSWVRRPRSPCSAV